MIQRMEVADVARLYDTAAADNALIEIELDTQQLRAITEDEARALINDDRMNDGNFRTGDELKASTLDPQFSDSLEALLRLSWPVWKATS